jgi:hypothetical protein
VAQVIETFVEDWKRPDPGEKTGSETEWTSVRTKSLPLEFPRRDEVVVSRVASREAYALP